MVAETGTIPFTRNGETFLTSYEVIGDLSSGHRPLVLLHGGPGFPHDYMLVHKDFGFECPLIFYDQTGGGKSTHLPQKTSEFWTVEFFLDELENVLQFFHVADDFDLLGHSWGGMLAASFAAYKQPKGLKHLIIADSPASMPLWVSGIRRLLDEFPECDRNTLLRHEKDGTTSSKEYQEVIFKFYRKHLCRKPMEEWPEELNRSFAILESDPTVYNLMQGPSELTITGTLKEWTIIDDLHLIKSSTLVLNSVHDEACDECVLPFFEHISKVKWFTFPHGSHLPFIDDREKYTKVVGAFLKTSV